MRDTAGRPATADQRLRRCHLSYACCAARAPPKIAKSLRLGGEARRRAAERRLAAEQLGTSVATDGDIVVAGAPFWDRPTSRGLAVVDVGAVLVFEDVGPHIFSDGFFFGNPFAWSSTQP